MYKLINYLLISFIFLINIFLNIPIRNPERTNSTLKCLGNDFPQNRGTNRGKTVFRAFLNEISG